jgi:hypothetical protein
MVYIMGGVFSRAEWATSVSGLVGPLAFHTICMALGVFLVGKAAPVKQTV